MAERRGRKTADGAFLVLAASATMVGFLALAAVVVGVTVDGVGHFSTEFFSGFASRYPERAGIRAALFGTLWVVGITGLISFPLAVGAAIYLEEYAPPGWISRAVRMNITSLAGIPSIVYGILGLALFVRVMGLGRSVLAGAFTLSLLVIPIITLASVEAIRAVPQGRRMAALALGASRWQVVRYQVLPAALPGIVSGALLALARAVGETAPLVMIGFMTFISFSPENVGDPFTVLPLQIFSWITRGEEFGGLAAAAILVLLFVVFGLNVAAILVRKRLEKEH